jgi:hypothetical protein
MPRPVVIDLEEYPLLLKLRDPEGALRGMIDTQYSVFASQVESQPSAQVLQDIANACSSLRTTSDAMTRDLRDMNSSLSRDLRDMSQNQKTSLTTMNDVVQKIPVLFAKSVSRGVVGEKCLLDYLKETFCSSDYQFEETGTIARSGDILVSKRDYHCLCDAKFYTKKVPKAEVLKLKRDMEERHVRCGVLVSFESGIAGYTNLDLEFFTTERNELCCVAVVGNAKECPAKVEMSIRFLETIWKTALQQDVRSTARSTLQDKAKQVFRDVLDSTEDLVNLIKDSEQQKKHYEDFHRRLLTIITTHKTRIEERLRILELDS